MVLIRSTSTTLKNHSRAKCCFPLVVRIRTWIEFIQKNKKCSLHRPKGMIATLPYIHHVTALTWNTSFVPDPYIDKKTAKSRAMLRKIATLSKKQHCTTAMIATLTHIVCRSFGYRQKKQHVHCIAPKEWLPHALTYNSALTGNTSWMQRPNATDEANITDPFSTRRLD